MKLKKQIFSSFAMVSLFFLPGCYLLCLFKAKPEDEVFLEKILDTVFEETISKDQKNE